MCAKVPASLCQTMRFTLWCSVVFSALFLQVRGQSYVKHYAEERCQRYKDDSIVYQLAPSGRHSAAIIKATNLLSYSYPFNCNITLSVSNSDDRHVLLSVRKVSFPSRTDCANYIKIYDGKKDGYKLCTKYDIPGKTIDFTGSENSSGISFLYHTEFYTGSKYSFDDDFFFSGFEVLATVYTKVPCGKELSFPCDNGRCISRELRFDGYDNCGDGSDERRFGISIRLPGGAIVGIVITILFAIAVIAGIVLVRRKRAVKVTTYTAPSQPLRPAGPQIYPQQTYAPFPPYPQGPMVQNQYSGVPNPSYGQPPPPYQ